MLYQIVHAKNVKISEKNLKMQLIFITTLREVSVAVKLGKAKAALLSPAASLGALSSGEHLLLWPRKA